MKALEIFAIWLFAPTACTVVIACLLSIFGFKPPKQRNDGWFKGPDW